MPEEENPGTWVHLCGGKHWSQKVSFISKIQNDDVIFLAPAERCPTGALDLQFWLTDWLGGWVTVVFALALSISLSLTLVNLESMLGALG